MPLDRQIGGRYCADDATSVHGNGKSFTKDQDIADIKSSALKYEAIDVREKNGFEHDPEVATDVRIALLNEAAETGAMLAAAHVAFPSIGHIAKNGEGYRFVPVQWDY